MDSKLSSYQLPVTGRNILRFALPTIVMTVFNTFYTMVDGLFVSNLIGTDALSAINLTAPAIGLITAVSGAESVSTDPTSSFGEYLKNRNLHSY